MIQFVIGLGILLTSFNIYAQESELDQLMVKLRAKRDVIRTWAPLCPDGSQSHGSCPFGDMTIFSGMGCLSGEQKRCDDVKRSQGPDGRWWRSPLAVGNDNEINTFSRDQMQGALSYLVATRDVEAALKWQDYLEAHHRRMCPRADNNRCVITLGSSQLFGAVWEHLGLKPAKWMNRGKWITNIYDPIQTRVQPADFPMHLTANSYWIQKEIEKRGGPKVPKSDRKSVRILVKREPTNPYFKFLRDGATVEVANIILEKCPDTRPEAEVLDWAWQRSQDDRPWEHASGHDCIFLINLFENELTAKR